jgi:hypothetical protein
MFAHPFEVEETLTCWPRDKVLKTLPLVLAEDLTFTDVVAHFVEELLVYDGVDGADGVEPAACFSANTPTKRATNRAKRITLMTWFWQNLCARNLVTCNKLNETYDSHDIYMTRAISE